MPAYRAKGNSIPSRSVQPRRHSGRWAVRTAYSGWGLGGLDDRADFGIGGVHVVRRPHRAVQSDDAAGGYGSRPYQPLAQVLLRHAGESHAPRSSITAEPKRYLPSRGSHCERLNRTLTRDGVADGQSKDRPAEDAAPNHAVSTTDAQSAHLPSVRELFGTAKACSTRCRMAPDHVLWDARRV